MSAALGNDEGFKRSPATAEFRCSCGRGAGQWIFARADGATRCTHCQLRARASSMTAEESVEMLRRIAAVCADVAAEESSK